MVIECKGGYKISMNQKIRISIKDYAVGRRSLYGSYLSKVFNVIAIGISGENEDVSKIIILLTP